MDNLTHGGPEWVIIGDDRPSRGGAFTSPRENVVFEDTPGPSRATGSPDDASARRVA